MNKTLYVIGNGFDLAHGFKTSYWDYAEYLKKNIKSLYQQIVNNCGLKENDIWSDFEASLGEINPNSLADYEDFNPSTDEDYDKGSWKGMYRTEDTVTDNLNNFLFDLESSFYDWISQIKIDGRTKFVFDKSACYLTFNYTHTLEEIYHISNPLHIHGDVSDRNSIVLGHANDLREDLSYSILDSVNKSLEQFAYEDTYKNSQKIYDANIEFFESLTGVENIVILGHSLSAVDSIYFNGICSNVDLDNCKFYVSYYDKSEIERKKEFLTSLGVKEENLIFSTISKISDMMDKSNFQLDFED